MEQPKDDCDRLEVYNMYGTTKGHCDRLEVYNMYGTTKGPL